MSMCGNDNRPESDALLIRRLQAGEMAAFDELFGRYRKGLLAYVTGMLHDAAAAEDIVQESFIKLADRIGQIKPERGVSAWLYRVARNNTIDRLRKHKREVLPGDVEVLRTRERVTGDSLTPAQDLVARETHATIRAALERLPPKERDLLLLRFYGDRSFKEIASIVKRPLGTVLWQVHRSLAKLRHDMEPG